MHIEKRVDGEHTRFYLSHSFRSGGNVRKVRKYLGCDLTDREVERARKRFEGEVAEKARRRASINSPLKRALEPWENDSIREILETWNQDGIVPSDEDWQHLTGRFVHESNSLEGSTVDIDGVGEILRFDRWPLECSREEIAETYGVARAFEKIRKSKEHISISLVRELHETVYKNSLPGAGSFIKESIRERRGRDMEVYLSELIGWYEINRDVHHPLVLAAAVHCQFLEISPFKKGNGTIARLLLNNILIKHEMRPVSVSPEMNDEYRTAVSEYHVNGNIKQILKLIIIESKRQPMHY